MNIHNEGKKIIPVAFFFIAVLDALIYILLKDFFIFYILVGTSLILALLIVYFFRIPSRKIEINKNHILSPADGEIVEILERVENEYFKDKRIQVSIFMSPLNVHQNRAPVSGEISYQKHKNGVYYPAFVKKSSEKNEHCSTVFKTENGIEIMTRQIAGVMARRIATYKKPGDQVDQGSEFGFIRFGSRVDLFLPTYVKINVNLHQKSVGGKTIIAKFQ